MRLIFDCPSNGTELVRAVSGPNPPSTVEVRFEPLSANDSLRGEPSEWFNSPGPGQALVGAIPVPGLAGDPPTEKTLEVAHSLGGTLLVPVKIKRV